MKKSTAILGILLHGFFLVSVNLFSLAVAFAVVQITSLPPNKLLHSGIALSVNLIIYYVVYQVMKQVQKELIVIEDFAMFATIFLISLALMPAVFYPLHYATSGNWSTFDNLLAIWPFQMLVNGLCLIFNFYILSKKVRA